MKSLLASILILFTVPALAGDITVEEAWIREAPPTMSMLGGFMTLHNQGDTDISIVSAEGADFGWIELHRSIMQDGMARMVPQDKITVPAGGRVELKPGDYHLMLMEPRRALKEGDTSKVSVTFDNGEIMEIELKVRKGGDMMMHMNH